MIQLLNLNTNTSPITAICTACTEARGGEEATHQKSWTYESVCVLETDFQTKKYISVSVCVCVCGFATNKNTHSTGKVSVFL